MHQRGHAEGDELSQAQIVIVGFAVAGVLWAAALGLGYLKARRRMRFAESRLVAMRWPTPPTPPWAK